MIENRPGTVYRLFYLWVLIAGIAGVMTNSSLLAIIFFIIAFIGTIWVIIKIFDHKTKERKGCLTEITLEQWEWEQEMERAGILRSTRHPSDEDLAAMNEIFAKQDVKKESEEAAIRAKMDS